MSRSQFFSPFFKCSNATIPLTLTLLNMYPSSNEINKRNGTMREDCIACHALFNVPSYYFRLSMLSSSVVTETSSHSVLVCDLK